jgi:phosphoglycerol transferase MdoB-like AlkP superfamily enzyme
MLKGILILVIIVLVFALAANYLFLYAVNQKAKLERQRQDNLYWKAFNAIVFYGEHPDAATEQKATLALDEAHQNKLSTNRELILQNYFQDLQRCYQGKRESCNKANTDMNEAIKAPR